MSEARTNAGDGSGEKTASMTPCRLALSPDAMPGSRELGRAGMRHWRVLSLADRRELGSGNIEVNCGDSLALVRDKAAGAVRARGFEPLEFVMEADPDGGVVRPGH
jgi:hypothetical protein